jgi:hypothetical protein
MHLERQQPAAIAMTTTASVAPNHLVRGDLSLLCHTAATRPYVTMVANTKMNIRGPSWSFTSCPLIGGCPSLPEGAAPQEPRP